MYLFSQQKQKLDIENKGKMLKKYQSSMKQFAIEKEKEELEHFKQISVIPPMVIESDKIKSNIEQVLLVSLANY